MRNSLYLSLTLLLWCEKILLLKISYYLVLFAKLKHYVLVECAKSVLKDSVGGQGAHIAQLQFSVVKVLHSSGGHYCISCGFVLQLLKNPLNHVPYCTLLLLL